MLSDSTIGMDEAPHTPDDSNVPLDLSDKQLARAERRPGHQRRYAPKTRTGWFVPHPSLFIPTSLLMWTLQYYLQVSLPRRALPFPHWSCFFYSTDLAPDWGPTFGAIALTFPPGAYRPLLL